MYTAHQTTVLGNEDLYQEWIRTYEGRFSYQFNKHVAGTVNYFHNRVKDLIVLDTLSTSEMTSPYKSSGRGHIQGIEIETKIDISNGNYLFMNYTF